MIDKQVCDDPAPGDIVTKGKRTRTVLRRDGYDVHYTTHTGKHKMCFITTWQDWCTKVDYAERPTAATSK